MSIRERIKQAACSAVWRDPDCNISSGHQRLIDAAAREALLIAKQSVFMWQVESSGEGNDNDFARERLSAYENVVESLDALLAELSDGQTARETKENQADI